MRYTRLRRQIENGTLIGTHGTPFQGGAEKIAEAQRKRRRSVGLSSIAKGKDGGRGDLTKKKIPRAALSKDSKTGGSTAGEETSEEDMPLMKRCRSKEATETKIRSVDGDQDLIKAEQEEKSEVLKTDLTEKAGEDEVLAPQEMIGLSSGPQHKIKTEEMVQLVTSQPQAPRSTEQSFDMKKDPEQPPAPKEEIEVPDYHELKSTDNESIPTLAVMMSKAVVETDLAKSLEPNLVQIKGEEDEKSNLMALE